MFWLGLAVGALIVAVFIALLWLDFAKKVRW